MIYLLLASQGYTLILFVKTEWVQVQSDTYWYSIMVSAGVLYTQDEGSSPYTSTILEFQSGLMAQSAKLMFVSSNLTSKSNTSIAEW